VSAKTIKVLALRQILRSAFIVELTDELAELSWILFEVASGGYAAVQAKALEAAKPVTALRLLTDEERRALRRGAVDWNAFQREAEPQEEEPGEDE
jgi:hypothetical protein